MRLVNCPWFEGSSKQEPPGMPRPLSYLGGVKSEATGEIPLCEQKETVTMILGILEI
jgi:hypothetical protein